MVSFLLSIMALSGIISFFNLKNLELSILSPQDIFAKTPVNLKIKAKNKYFFDLFLLRVRILENETIIPYLKGEKIFSISVTFPKRGKYLISEALISSYFPFYFFKRLNRLPINIEFTILPYPLKCDILFLISEEKTKTETHFLKGKSYEGELTGVRAYCQGDPLKYIHWKATAKTSEIKIKEFSPQSGKPIVINLSDLSGSLEEKISKATYALITLSKMGNPVGLKLGTEFYKPEIGESHVRRLLYALAIYTTE